MQQSYDKGYKNVYTIRRKKTVDRIVINVWGDVVAIHKLSSLLPGSLFQSGIGVIDVGGYLWTQNFGVTKLSNSIDIIYK